MLQLTKTGMLCGALVAASVAGLLTSGTAEAGSRKGFYSEDYQFDGPAKGFEGRAGDYYCSYQRIPNRVCTVDAGGNERCKVKGWTLRQYCY